MMIWMGRFISLRECIQGQAYRHSLMNVTSIIPFSIPCMLSNHTWDFITPHNWSISPIINANLITFDLDDTIFPVGPVVNGADVTDSYIVVLHHKMIS